MMKARYSVHNIGHYGLMFQHYTHFTSPIRRYPDLMVHRLLARYAEGGRSVSATKYEDLCEHCSEREQIAATAERASIKYKQTEFMGERIGQEFDGVISGVTEFGIYVEDVLTKCEGMVPLRDLSSDYYEFDEDNYRLVGRRTKRVYNRGACQSRTPPTRLLPHRRPRRPSRSATAARQRQRRQRPRQNLLAGRLRTQKGQ